MERDREIALLAECLELVRGKRPFMGAEETLIPVEKYTDQARFEAELALMRSAPNVVAHASQLQAPGDFITRDVAGTPAIVVRQRDGSLRAFVNVCRHRGATLELRERGRCTRFVCPYHAWSYETDGSLAAVRHQEGFPTLDVAATSLADLPCFELAGLVWVTPERAGKPVSSPDDSELLAGELEWLGCPQSIAFASESKVWNTNWKLIVDGGLESYHFKIAHRRTIAGFFADNVSIFERLGNHMRSVLPRLSILELAERPQREWSIREHTHLLYSIAPNASILVQEGHFELIMMTPIAIDQTRVDIVTVVPRPENGAFSEKATAFYAANHAFTTKTLDEDFVIAEQIQRGMSTGVNEHFRFARFEGALSDWHRRLDRRLGL